MPFKGKPSINKRNREMALRERQKDKIVRREQRSATKQNQAEPEPILDPVTQLPLTPDEIEYREFQQALKARAEEEAAANERTPVKNR